VDSRAGLDGCGKSLSPPTGIRSPDRPARSGSLYRLSRHGQRCWRMDNENNETCSVVTGPLLVAASYFYVCLLFLAFLLVT